MTDDAGGGCGGVHVDDFAADPTADEHADAVGEEDDEALGGGAQGLRRFHVDVDLTGDKEEVVADAVHDDAEIEHPDQAVDVAESKAQIADDPGEHAEHEGVFHADLFEEERQREHEEEFGKLAEGHFADGVLKADLVEKRIRESVVELERDADQEGSGGEDGEVAIFEKRKRFGGENVAELEAVAFAKRRRVGKREAVDRHDDRGDGGDANRNA